MHREINNR